MKRMEREGRIKEITFRIERRGSKRRKEGEKERSEERRKEKKK